MASPSRSNTTRARKLRREKKTRRIQYKKQLLVQRKNKVREASSVQEISSHCSSDSTAASSSSDIHHDPLKVHDAFGFKEVSADDDNPPSSGCCTPKAKRFRIPDIVICPPAPRKQRAISDCSSLQRRPTAFFAPPDIELFFFFAPGEQAN